MNFLAEMNATVEKYKGYEDLTSTAAIVKENIDLLAGMAMYFAKCGKEGKFMVPISGAFTFLNMMGTILCGWMHLWMAGIASEKLEEIYGQKGVDTSDKKALKALAADDKEVAFYQGKIFGASFFARNILPRAKSMAESIKTEDMSMMHIHDASFACGEL